MKKSLVFFVLLSGLFAVGCGTLQKVEAVVSPTHEQIVSDHLTLRDPAALLDDLEKYPEFKDRIESTLYGRIDYQKYDYRQLKEFSLIAQEDFSASVFFDSLLVDRQEAVLSSLAEEEDLDAIGAFYRENSGQYDFLRDALKEAYFVGVDSLEYFGLKSLHTAFLNTDLDKLVYPRYSSVRGEIVKGIMEELNPYFAAEKEYLESVDDTIRQDLETYIENGVISVIADLSEKLDRGLFKRTFKRVDMDNYSITEYAERLVAKYIDNDFITRLICDSLDDYIQASTITRYDYLNNYCQDASDNTNYYINGEMGSKSVEIVVDNSKARDIQDLKTFNDATTVTSLALMFTPVGWVGILVDALDFYNGFTESSKINTMLDQLSESLYVSYTEQVNNYLSKLYTRVDKARKDSQDYIIRYFYEVF